MGGTDINDLLGNQQTEDIYETDKLFTDHQSTAMSLSDKSNTKSIYHTNGDIDRLADYIKRDLERNDKKKKKPKKKKKKIDIQVDEKPKPRKNFMETIPEWVKEIVLFVIIYFIFSLGFVKSGLGKYIKYVNPNEEGEMSFIGIIIYGILLISVFLIARYFILKH